MSMPALLQIDRVSLTYPGSSGLLVGRRKHVPVLDRVCLSIRTGETWGLVGPSGSGKTTLLNCLFRIAQPDDGQVLFQGVDLAGLRGEALQRFRRQAQLVLQNPDVALTRQRTIGALVAEPLIAHGICSRPEARVRACELLLQTGLPASLVSRRPSELSQGQRQRVLLARALALQPQFLAADEPFAALDVVATTQLCCLLAELKRTFALTLLIVSHDQLVLHTLCDNIAVLEHGKIAAVHRLCG